MDPNEKHPSVFGLVALVAVAVSVGLVLGVVALVGTRVLGVGGNDSGSANNAGATLILPTPSATRTPNGPAVTLSSSPTGSTATKPHRPENATKKPDKAITLQASVVNASPMQLFQLSGVYPGGEGALLRLQRQMPGGGWQDFGIPDVVVKGGSFSTSATGASRTCRTPARYCCGARPPTRT